MNNERRFANLPKAQEKPSKRHLLSIILCTLLTAAQQAWARDIRTEKVRFERGASSAVVEGSIRVGNERYEIPDAVIWGG